MSFQSAYVADIITNYLNSKFGVDSVTVYRATEDGVNTATIYFDKNMSKSLCVKGDGDNYIYLYDRIDEVAKMVKPEKFKMSFKDFMNGVWELANKEISFKRKNLYSLKDGSNFLTICSEIDKSSAKLKGFKNLLSESRLYGEIIDEIEAELPNLIDEYDFASVPSHILEAKRKKVVVKLGGVFADEYDPNYEIKSGILNRRLKRAILKIVDGKDCLVSYFSNAKTYEIYCDKSVADDIAKELVSPKLLHELNDSTYFICPKPISEMAYKICDAFKKINYDLPYSERSMNTVEEAHHYLKAAKLIACGNKITYSVKTLNALETKEGIGDALTSIGCNKSFRLVTAPRQYEVAANGSILVLEKINNTQMLPIVYPIISVADSDIKLEYIEDDMALIEDLWKIAVGTNRAEVLMKTGLVPNYSEATELASDLKPKEWFVALMEILEGFNEEGFKDFMEDIGWNA